MRQLTASEASNDEMERQRFEKWVADFTGQTLRYVEGQRSGNGRYYNEYIDVPWQVWQAALKSKQGEV